jgi:hypothetical protein
MPIIFRYKSSNNVDIKIGVQFARQEKIIKKYFLSIIWYKYIKKEISNKSLKLSINTQITCIYFYLYK